MYDCLNQNGTTCSAHTADQTLVPDPLLNAGDNQASTYESFPAGDHLTVRVNVLSGDLEIKQTDISLAGILSPVVIGQVYNSLDSGARQHERLRAQPLPRLGTLGRGLGPAPRSTPEAPRPSTTRPGECGSSPATSAKACGTSYVSPGGIDATLSVICSGTTQTGFNLEFNQTNDTAVLQVDLHRQRHSTAVLFTDTDRDHNAVSYAYATTRRRPSCRASPAQGEPRTSSTSPTLGTRSPRSPKGRARHIRSATLGYTSGNLTSVLDPAGNTTQFSYTGGLLTPADRAERGHHHLLLRLPGPGLPGHPGPERHRRRHGVHLRERRRRQHRDERCPPNNWTYTTDYADRVTNENDPSGRQVYGSALQHRRQAARS